MDNKAKDTKQPPKVQPSSMTGFAMPLVGQENIAPGSIKQRHLVPSPTQKGDMYYGANGGFLNLPIGLASQVLSVVAGVPKWGSASLTGIATARPTSGTYAGQQYFATDTLALSIWTGTAWKSVTLS